MSIKVAINGFGRIGRSVLRALYASARQKDIKLVAINDVESINHSLELLKGDAVDGVFEADLKVKGNSLMVGQDEIQYFSQVNPVKLPWKELDIDVVLECTGVFTQAEQSYMHCLAGAKKVLISAFSDDKVDATIVYGVNHDVLRPEFKVVSNGSCTINCLAPMLKVLNEQLGIESGLSTTLHAYNKEQLLAKEVGTSLIPTPTHSPSAIGRVLPELDGKINGLSIRVPTINVAVVDVTFNSEKETSVNEVNALMQKAALSGMNGVLKCNEQPSISAGFIDDSASCIFDLTQTMVSQRQLVKVVAWFDNEWGFSNRMLDTAEAMMNC